MNVMSVASEQAYGTCANCGSALVSDQRYCLECGAPASPVRLAFLDVLQNGQDVAVRSTPAGYEATVVSAAGVLPPSDAFAQSGVNAWLRRNSGVLSLLSVLALCLIAGLLIGHWATQSGSPSKQVIELKGLPASATLPASAAATSSTPATKSSSGNAGGSKTQEEAEEKAEAKEAAAVEKAAPPPAKKINLSKLSKSTGKKHQQEIEANGPAPIETG